ncbi:Transporter, small conductance mechanosensitive ion channel family protein [Acidipropionibacterium acidipropionici ATCC 4875]|uniref:Transporter, small conductance mechanosensitive ion channel family protein n=2 Tax=Acidipropionibacterium acidipropionici TaxID=1748 RepID=K7RXC5_ACIA4|nr:Transporter, small conductance mechanosensitive ion channel family protein [Acidipropionibacterium acidipropionici ATCC 4875]
MLSLLKVAVPMKSDTAIFQSFTWLWPSTPIHLAIIIVVALVARWLMRKGIDQLIKWMNNRSARRPAPEVNRTGRAWSDIIGRGAERQAKRTTTMGRLLSNIGVAIILIIAIFSGFSAVGIQLTPIIASAGVAGIAIAFGAQSLVKDLLTGMFLIFEDQYGVGDVVEIDKLKGTVEEVGLRTTRIRDFNGMSWYLRNGEILKVGNVTQGWAQSIVDIGVHQSEDPQIVMRVIRKVLAEVDSDPEFAESLLEEPKVLGVTDISNGVMTFQVAVKCVAQTQFDVIRTIRRKIKDAFDEARIRGGFDDTRAKDTTK